MADTTQITNDNNTLSHVSAQLNPLNITITELKKGTVNLPTINNNPSFSQPLPTFTSKSKISRPILSIHNTVTDFLSSTTSSLIAGQNTTNHSIDRLKSERVKLVSSG